MLIGFKIEPILIVSDAQLSTRKMSFEVYQTYIIWIQQRLNQSILGLVTLQTHVDLGSALGQFQVC